MKFSKVLILFVGMSFLCLVAESCFNDANANTSAATILNDPSTLQWHSIAEMEQLQKVQSKKVIVDVYTEWCKWCKVMDQQTFSDAELIKYLNENFYMVKLNAEDKSTLTFKGKEFKYVQGGRKGYNTLAATLCKGQLSYPSFVILDEYLNTIQVTRGYKDAEQFRGYLDQIPI